MKTTMSLEGFDGLENALDELPKATAKNVGRKALRAGAEPMLAEYQARAPQLTGHMVETAGIGTKLSKRQRALHRKEESRDHVEMFVGAGPNPQATQQEFGNENHGAQPALIPAFENNKNEAVKIIGRVLWSEIEKAAKRLARKAAKLAAVATGEGD